MKSLKEVSAIFLILEYEKVQKKKVQKKKKKKKRKKNPRKKQWNIK